MNECFVHSNCTEANKQKIRTLVCQQLKCKPEYQKDGNDYCVLHSPTKEKSFDFAQEFLQRIENKQTDFSYVFFPNEIFFATIGGKEKIFDTELIFNNATFTEEILILATFKQKVSFDFATFHKKVSFSFCNFEADLSFLYVEFLDKLNFVSTNFQKKCKVFFSHSVFKENAKVWFQNSIIEGVIHLDQTVIEGFIIFQSIENKGLFDYESSRMNLRYAQIQGAGRLIFDGVILFPNWFLETDARKITFVNPKWKNYDEHSPKTFVFYELKLLEHRKYLDGKPQLKITYRQLAENAENNNRFEEASKFRQMAFECERLERKEKISKWFQESINCSSLLGKIGEKAKSFPYDFVHWLYRWTSGYGENRLWAFFVLFLIVTISAIFYSTPFCEFPNGQNGVRSLDFIESIA